GAPVSEAPGGPGWWEASDGRWYPPQSHPDARAAAGPWTQPPPGAAAPAGWRYGPPVPGGPPHAQLAPWSMTWRIARIPAPGLSRRTGGVGLRPARLGRTPAGPDGPVVDDLRDRRHPPLLPLLHRRPRPDRRHPPRRRGPQPHPRLGRGAHR